MADRVLSTDQVLFADDLRRWRERRGMSTQQLADATGYSHSRVSHIEGHRQTPAADFARLADEALDAGGVLWKRWEAISGRGSAPRGKGPDRELRTIEFVGWLADHSTYTFRTLYDGVCDMIARANAEPRSRRHSREYAKRLVSREGIAQAMRSHYGPDGFYVAEVAGRPLPLSMLTGADWLDVTVPLGGPCESVRHVPPPAWDYRLDDLAVAAAVERLADAEINGTVMVNNPLYRLLAVDLQHGQLGATVTTVPFAEHAMASELMEGETLAAVATETDEMPLRDRHLPSTAAAFDLTGRACVGGPTTLLAAARKLPGGERDYVLLTQERSNSVLNLAGKLAVVPKGFHQPTGEAASEVAISSTLRREFEEELLGRDDLEQVTNVRRRPVDLLHPSNITPAFSWLLDRPGAWRAECTGLGFNMLTSNYEFSCLVVIEDDDWWDQFSNHLFSNWEAVNIQRHSSRDTEGLVALIQDRRWGNESLFAVLQGLRRLAESGDRARLALPSIELAL